MYSLLPALHRVCPVRRRGPSSIFLRQDTVGRDAVFGRASVAVDCGRYFSNSSHAPGVFSSP